MIEIFKQNIFLLGGYSALIIGISSWVGMLISKKISSDREFSNLKEITKLKNELDLLAHQKKGAASRLDELEASSLQEIHNELVDLELSVEGHLSRIYEKWMESFEKSQELNQAQALDETNTLIIELQNKKVSLESKLALAEGIIEFIAYEAFNKWGPEFQEIRKLVLKKEVYINEEIFLNCQKLLKQVETVLNTSVRSISSLYIKEVEKENKVTKEFKCKIDSVFNDLQRTCRNHFSTTRKEITSQIRKSLQPK